MTASLTNRVRIARVNVWVFDQPAALDFYVGKLGFELGDDIDLGFMRWLTVHPAGQPEVQLILCDPRAVMAPEQAEGIKKMLEAGIGGGPQLVTDDCQGTYDELVARGVTFPTPPTDRGYGIDAEAVDPFGNLLRFVQPATEA